MQKLKMCQLTHCKPLCRANLFYLSELSDNLEIDCTIIQYTVIYMYMYYWRLVKLYMYTCTVQSCNFRCTASQKLKHCPATNFCIQIFVCLLCVNSKHHAFLYQDIICTFHHIMYCTSITSEDRKNIGWFKRHTEKSMILLHVHVGRFAKLTMYILYMQADFAHGKLIAWYMYVF